MVPDMFRVVTVIHHTDFPSQIAVSVALCKVKMMMKYMTELVTMMRAWMHLFQMKKKKNINLIVYCIRWVDFHSLLEQSRLSFLAVEFEGLTVLWKAPKELKESAG